MKKFFNKPVAKVILILVIIVGILGTGFFILNTSQNKELSAEQLDKKFNCSRITADVKHTDVFCNNPKFYNNPKSVNYDDYYDYYQCNERFKNEPPLISSKESSPSVYNAYYNCKDPAKLEQLRQDFIKDLIRIKAESEKL